MSNLWSKKFYKALQAVGKPTEQEKIGLLNVLTSVSRPTVYKNIPPPPKPPENKVSPFC